MNFYGDTDMRLTSKPEITYFKNKYFKLNNNHTLQHTSTIIDNPTFNNKTIVNIPQNGDYIKTFYIHLTISPINIANCKNISWIRRLGHFIFDNITIYIGDNIYKKYNPHWLDTYYELFIDGNHSNKYLYHIGDRPDLIEFNNKNKPEFNIIIPLHIIHKNDSSSFPIINLDTQTISLHIMFNNYNKLLIQEKDTIYTTPKIIKGRVITEYIHMNSDNIRSSVAKDNYTILYENMQYTIHPFNFKDTQYNEQNIILEYTNILKELIWITSNNNFNNGLPFLDYGINWNIVKTNASKKLLLGSCKISNINNFNNDYVVIGPNSSYTYNNIIIQNTTEFYLSFNSSSLIYNNINLIDNITGTIVLVCDRLFLEDIIITIPLNIDILSVSTNDMTDTRYCNYDVIIYQPDNYSLYLDYTGDIITSSKILHNNDIRINTYNNNFYSKLQNFYYHKKHIKNGIYLYTYSNTPTLLHPNGINNELLMVDTSLSVNFNNKINNDTIANIYLLGLSYNTIKIQNGQVSINNF